MFAIDGDLQQNITKVAKIVWIIHDYLASHAEPGEAQVQEIALCCAEVALLSMAASDEIGVARDPGERMLRQELSSALKQITMNALNVQEWESLENIRTYVGVMAKRCGFVARLLKIPEEEYVPRRNVEAALIPFISQIDDDSLEIIDEDSGDDDIDKLKGKLQAYREILTGLVFERDNLLHVVCKEIEADYMRELGSIDVEIYHTECEVRRLHRKLEMMQAAVNRREVIQTKKIEEDLKDQFEEYQKVYEEFVRRIRESGEFQKRRKKAAGSRRDKMSEGASSESQQREESEEKQIKKLYRRIVKAMHPDIHPNQDTATKELFKRAIRAYKEEDLKTLNEIAGTIDGETESSPADQIDKLREEMNRLLALIGRIKAEIRLIKTRYPYTKKEILDDPAALAKEKERLQKRLERAKKQRIIFKERIAEMEVNHG